MGEEGGKQKMATGNIRNFALLPVERYQVDLAIESGTAGQTCPQFFNLEDPQLKPEKYTPKGARSFQEIILQATHAYSAKLPFFGATSQARVSKVNASRPKGKTLTVADAWWGEDQYPAAQGSPPTRT